MTQTDLLRAGVGTLLTVDIGECAPDLLNDPNGLLDLLTEACRAAGATVLRDLVHHYEPHGVTAVVVLAESHAVLHSWPEHGVATLDLFACGVDSGLDAAVELVVRRLQGQELTRKRTFRGQPRSGTGFAPSGNTR